MNRPVDVIIPDAGPIISLAHADRLDLLEVFSRPIKIMDVVKLECLRKPQSPDHDRLQSWFHRSSNRVEIVDTPMATLYLRAAEQERVGEDTKATRGLGDATLAWALQNIERFAAKNSVALVLVEDRTLGAGLGRLNKGHILSTRSWLAALEESGHIASARQVIAEINQHGRFLSGLAIDRPASQSDAHSNWIGALRPLEGDG